MDAISLQTAQARLNIGVVGLRNNGKGHIKKLIGMPGVKLSAVADLDRGRAEAVRQEFDIDKSCTDANEILTDNSIDAVILSLPNHLHAPFAIKAMECGKHVYVEKPIAPATTEARKMIDVRNATGKILMVGMNYRYTKHYARARNEIAAGTIGNIKFVRAHFTRMRLSDGAQERGNWQWDRRMSGGGPLIDLGVHVLDVAMFLLGFPDVKSVYGVTLGGIGKEYFRKHTDVYTIEDMTAGYITLKNGAVINLETSFFLQDDTPRKAAITICGTTGGISDKGIYVEVDDKSVYLENDECAYTESAEKHFVDVLRGEARLESTPEQALMIMQIVEALYASAASGEVVHF